MTLNRYFEATVRDGDNEDEVTVYITAVQTFDKAADVARVKCRLQLGWLRPRVLQVREHLLTHDRPHIRS